VVALELQGAAAGNPSQKDVINRQLALERQRLDDQCAFNERLLQLLEAREGQRPYDVDARDRLVLVHSRARAAHRQGSAVGQRLPSSKLVLRKELQQLQSLAPRPSN
jgi:hypothetical protein